MKDTTDRRNPVVALLSTSAALVALTLALYAWSLARLRVFQPQYPSLVVFGLFTPPGPIHAAHGLFPAVGIATTMIVCVASVVTLRRNSPPSGKLLMTFFAHWIVFLAFSLCFGWAMLWSSNAQRYFGSIPRH